MMGFREDEKKARAAFSKFELIHIGISPSGQQNVALHHDVHAKESKKHMQDFSSFRDGECSSMILIMPIHTAYEDGELICCPHGVHYLTLEARRQSSLWVAAKYSSVYLSIVFEIILRIKIRVARSSYVRATENVILTT